MVDLEELYRLTQENNAMLKEILEYVRKVQDKNYLSNDYSREIAFVASKGVVKSARKLLTQFGAGITSQAFNKLAEAKGYLVTISHGEKKSFKSITEKGRIYGENQVNPNHPKSTQPLWYEDKFEDLLTDLGVKIYVD